MPNRLHHQLPGSRDRLWLHRVGAAVCNSAPGRGASAKPVLVMLALVLNLGITLLAHKRIVWREFWIILVLVSVGLPLGMLWPTGCRRNG